MDITKLLLLFASLRQGIETLRGLLDTAKQNKELSSEQEVQWAQELAAYRASPAGTPTAAGKL